MLLSSAVLAPACLVTFDDYPLGDPNATRPAVGIDGGAGSSSGGSAAGKGGGGGDVGAGGQGGSPGQPTPDEGLIDDFEDGDEEILELEGRQGSWRVSSEGDMSPVPSDPIEPEALVPARGESASALHTSGSGQSQWRGAVRANFESAFDAAGYSGIKFWARSADENEYPGRALLATPATASTCYPCGDHFGSDVVYTPEWQQYAVPFAEMSQSGWGDLQGEFEPSEIVAVQFSFEAGVPYDVWIDDVRFY